VVISVLIHFPIYGIEHELLAEVPLLMIMLLDDSTHLTP
jgi:hypothetical protein